MSRGAVIFDLDGLLVDTERVVRAAWADTVAEAGVEIAPAVVQSMVGRRVPDILAALTLHLGDEAQAAHLQARARHHVDRRLHAEPAAVKPGAHELLDVLDELALPRALATSSLRGRIELKAGHAGLFERMHAIVCGDEVTHGKPAPDIYLAAAAALDVDPRNCVALEDSGPGIASAVAAGMQALLVPDHGEPAAETVALATAVFDDLHGCIDFVRAQLA